MHLLQSGVPFNIIALWLGHESVNTTHPLKTIDTMPKHNKTKRTSEVSLHFDRPLPF